MRVIEFRGYCDYRKKWEFGGFAKISDDFFIVAKCDFFKALPNSIGQYTGLFDKNGTKIFEGDIVNHSGTTKIIEFYEGSFIAKQCGRALSEQSLINFATCRTFEVISNVFENEDLCYGRT